MKNCFIGKHEELHKLRLVAYFVRNFGGEVHPSIKIIRKQSWDNFGLVCTTFDKIQTVSNWGLATLLINCRVIYWKHWIILSESRELPRNLFDGPQEPLRWNSSCQLLRVHVEGASLFLLNIDWNFSLHFCGTLQFDHPCDAFCFNLNWKLHFFSWQIHVFAL